MSVVVTQADREAAAPILRLYGSENYAALCEKGQSVVDGLEMIQAFARHRTEATEELLEALKLARIAASSFRCKLEPHEMAQIDAAIAKAKGEQA